MKKILLLVLVAMLALSAAAVAESESYTIAVSLNDADEYRTQWLNEFTALCDAKGYEVISASAGSDASKQISDVESLLLQQPDIRGHARLQRGRRGPGAGRHRGGGRALRAV